MLLETEEVEGQRLQRHLRTCGAGRRIGMRMEKEGINKSREGQGLSLVDWGHER